MAYKNIAGLLGHEWISEGDVEIILREFPETHYKVWVEFTTDKSDIPLINCTRKERNLDRLVIGYKDGTNRLDPDPFVWHIDGPVDSYRVVYDSLFGARAFFVSRSKRPQFPQTRNEDPKVIKKMAIEMRHKLATYLRVSEFTLSKEKNGDLEFSINSLNSRQKTQLVDLIQNLEYDGLWMTVNVHFPYGTIDQFQRLDTCMELAKISEELEESEIE
jgi:hypothetical protein